jgi:hypothetical protein
MHAGGKPWLFMQLAGQAAGSTRVRGKEWGLMRAVILLLLVR